ncbi:MAG: peroxiredoxin [Acidimicrobiales bacterium]
MRVGDPAPDFTLVDDAGVTRSLAGLTAGGPVVLFFYPAAKTSGCTREACHFRDRGPEFAALGAQRVGVSMDGVERQHEFSVNNAFDYPLLCDVDGVVARLYGVKRSLDLLKVRRTTFVISKSRVVLDVIASEVRMEVHADRALAALAR